MKRYQKIQGWREQDTSYLDNEAVPPWSPTMRPLPPTPGRYFEAERRRPARPLNLESDVFVPAGQSAIVALFVTVGGVYLAMAFGWWPWHLSCFAGLAAGALWFVVWLALSRNLLWIIERVVNDDQGPDGQPQPLQLAEPDPVVLEVKAVDQRGRLQGIKRFGDLPNDLQDRLPIFAAGVLAGKGLSVSTWTGKGCLFSRQEYDQVMGALQDAGIVAWRHPSDPKQGREVTTRGRAALKRLSQF